MGNPTAIALTEGQVHDLVGADLLLPKSKGRTVIADKAYDADARVLEPLRQTNREAVIPPKRGRLVQRDYDRHTYRSRHLIENFFCKLKKYRAIATRYEKTARNYLGGVFLASIVILLH